jgi:hypothetical protein
MAKDQKKNQILPQEIVNKKDSLKPYKKSLKDLNSQK